MSEKFPSVKQVITQSYRTSFLEGVRKQKERRYKSACK